MDIAKQPTSVVNKIDTTNDTNLSLLEECLAKISIKDVADKLNVCIGTIRRWIELKNVPIQYSLL